jgi:TolB protein
MNVDGTNVRRLTSGNFVDRTPYWSPDAQRIAFESNRDGSFQIYTMNYDGSDIRQLTRGLSENTHAQWSKDNTRITFVSTRDGHNEIYVMSATDGANQTRLTNTPGNKNSSHPTWSHDSRRIAFESDRAGNYEIYVMNADGSDQKQITKTDTPSPKSNRFPYWVPSCDDRIAFSSNRDDPDLRIWVTNPDGSNQHRLRYERAGLLTSPNAPDEHAAWSGVPVLPLHNTPATPVGPTATSVSELLPKPSTTPPLAVTVSNAPLEQKAAVTSNPNPVSNPDPGLWGWLTSLWTWLTGK